MSKLSSGGLHETVQIQVPKDYPWRILRALVSDHVYSLDEQETSSILSVIRSRSYDRYLELAELWGPLCIPPDVPTLEKFQVKYQIASLIKKFRFPGDNKTRRSTALSKFYAAEAACKEFNAQDTREFYFSYASKPETHAAFKHAKRFMRKLLGEVLPPSSQLTEWSRHGPGANLDTKRGRTGLYDKYSNFPYSCTSNAAKYARLLIEDDARWLGALQDAYRREYNIPMHYIIDEKHFWNSVIDIIDTNRITFVPKNSQTDRSIAIEPSLNLCLQLGVDGYIRRRLKRWGIDLDDQSKNQRLAQQGSRLWSCPETLCTLDLAAASDTVTTRICKELLPSQWYCYLMEIRSPQGEVDGETISYEKISSMGNGFTFALESAIFAAICYAVSMVDQGFYDRDNIAVYGDDIIVPAGMCNLTVEMLKICGFTTNPEKSFVKGPFRESCGADFYMGHPVRPVFLTESPHNGFYVVV